jgi:hypothetical protein
VKYFADNGDWVGPVGFSLKAYYGLSLLWKQSGTLASVKDDSTNFDVKIPADELSCNFCY